MTDKGDVVDVATATPTYSRTILWAGVGMAVAFWFAEALIHSYVFGSHSFREEFLPLDDPHELWMRLLVCVLFLLFGWFGQLLVDRVHREREAAERASAEARRTLETIRILHGTLPICASCKNIRDDRGAWRQLEEYIRNHSEARFSHGLCPDCARKLYPDVADSLDWSDPQVAR